MPNRSRRNRRTYNYYRCPECAHQWMGVSIGRNNVSRQCRECEIDVQPYKQLSKPELDENRPCFGHYKCSECARTWMSANSWVGFGQKCQACNIMVMAHIQTPLRTTVIGDDKKRHPSELCGKCQSLGGNCRRERKQNKN